MFVWWRPLDTQQMTILYHFLNYCCLPDLVSTTNIMQGTLHFLVYWIISIAPWKSNLAKQHRRKDWVLLLVFVLSWVCSFPIIIPILCRENPLIRAFLLLIGVFTEHSGKILFEDLISVKGFRYFRLWL